MSFWLPLEQDGGGGGRAWHENDYCEIVRDVAGDLIEDVALVCLDPAQEDLISTDDDVDRRL